VAGNLFKKSALHKVFLGKKRLHRLKTRSNLWPEMNFYPALWSAL